VVLQDHHRIQIIHLAAAVHVTETEIQCVVADYAGVVLQHDHGIHIVHFPAAIHIAKRTLRIVHQNVIFAIGVKILVLALSALGLSNMWWAVFADVGVCVIAILNSMRALR